MLSKVKHQGDQTVYRTPVIITTNKEVFPNIDAFNHRMCTYYWKEAPYLKKYDKKLHPLMWPILKKSLMIIESECTLLKSIYTQMMSWKGLALAMNSCYLCVCYV